MRIENHFILKQKKKKKKAKESETRIFVSNLNLGKEVSQEEMDVRG